VDEEGNAVAVTYTLNEAYGSGVTVPGAAHIKPISTTAGISNLIATTRILSTRTLRQQTGARLNL